MRANIEPFHRFESIALPPGATGLLAGGVSFEVPPGRVLVCSLGGEVQANAGVHVPRVVPGLTWRLLYPGKNADNNQTQKITDKDDVPWTSTDGTALVRWLVPSGQRFTWSGYVSNVALIPAGVTAALVSVRGYLVDEGTPLDTVARLLGGLR